MIVNFLRKNSLSRSLTIIINDILICYFAVWISFYLRLEEFVDHYRIINFSIIAIALYIFFFLLAKIDKQLYRYLSFNSLKIYLKIFLFYLIIISLIIFLFNPVDVPRSIAIIHPFVFFTLIFLNRFIVFLILSYKKNELYKKQIIIIGTDNYESTSRLIANNKVVAFLENDSQKVNKLINGIKVLDITNLESIISKSNPNIDEVIFAMSNLNYPTKKKLISQILKFNIRILELNYLGNIVKLDYNFEFDSLFRRENKYSDLKSNLFDTNILITGGGGSIGSEIVEQIVSQNFKSLIVVDISEFNLYTIREKIINLENSKNIKFVLADIKNYELMSNLLQTNNVDIVYHAAAYKHVPILEENILSAIDNNFLATHNFAKTCLKNKIKKFILISSDKAVRPTNIMGATKRLAELSIQYINHISNDNNSSFSAVRFGNVIGSSGSVMPLFKRQIEQGGPVTVTHEKVNRFFMSIKEAAHLVIEASSLTKGGETFLLDMGKPINIYDLAKKIINFSGFKFKNKECPSGDIELIITGLRPGEKLYEELLVDHEASNTKHPFIYKSEERIISKKEFELIIMDISEAFLNKDTKKITDILKTNIIGFKK
jgi:FlaA1/EpsC-like NDP-sugar epimerase